VSKLITFESPRVGNKEFSSFINQVFPLTVRITHHRDIVVHLPPESFAFRHVPNEVFFKKDSDYKVCDGSGEDKSCSD